jgi:eukaryotic-like serine/threonine-protein kinase
MPLSKGDLLGPYEILAPIGKGGMGEVYCAHDPRTGRDVAIKVSAERFSERFDREVRAVAALNHPNICTLYDVGPNYLVMELVAGETLQGPLPLDETLRIARQISDALEYAHEKGVVHRDLKPANIKVTPQGAVKVLDFGLAKVGTTSTSASGVDRENSPTLSMAATQAGMILGTAAYMPPEQARGKPVDKRADIWAFGVVFYELLTGKRLFQGDDVTDILASVVKEQPDLSAVPANVQRLLKSCLEKDPKNRLRDIADAWRLLDESSQPAAAPRASRWGKFAWIATALALIALIPANLIHWREQPPALEPVRFQIQPPEKTRFGIFLALSPDGRKVAFRAIGENGTSRLWVRSLDTLEAKDLAEVAAGAFLFWSPDSRYIAFQHEGKLKKVEASGGPPQNLCDSPAGQIVGGTWSSQGVILIGGAAGVWKVSDGGGAPSPVTSLDPSQQDIGHALPIFLPDGRHFVYVRVSAAPERGGTYIGSLNDAPGKQSSKRLLSTESTVAYSPSLNPGASANAGYLFFLRDSSLMAQPFDTVKLDFAGDAVPVADPVGRSANGVVAFFSVSSTGALIYQSGNQSQNQLSWIDREGKVLSTASESGTYSEIAISPDAKSVSMTSGGPGRSDISVLDLARSVNTRFTFDPAADNAAVWSPDGKEIVFSSDRDGLGNIYIKASGGAANEEVLYKSPEPKTPNDWSRDGRFLLYTAGSAKTGNDLWYLPMTGERTPKPFVQTAAQEGLGQFSPDGRFVAYVSNESGQNEIYVRSFPDGRGKWQISKGGGVDPRWRRDGKEITYLSGTRMMAVEVSTSPAFQPGTPKMLLEAPIIQAGNYNRNNGYDISPDGKKILATMPVGQTLTAPSRWCSTGRRG